MNADPALAGQLMCTAPGCAMLVPQCATTTQPNVDTHSNSTLRTTDYYYARNYGLISNFTGCAPPLQGDIWLLFPTTASGISSDDAKDQEHSAVLLKN